MAGSDFWKALITLCSAIAGAVIGGLVSQWNPVFLFEGYIEGWALSALSIYLRARMKQKQEIRP